MKGLAVSGERQETRRPRCAIPGRGIHPRVASLLGIASLAILIAGFVIESHFDIFPDDDDDDDDGD
jgi:hypothetical protein